MSTAQQLNEVADYGYIQFDDLEINKKYKVLKLATFQSALNNTKRICMRVEIDGGYLILPERFDTKVDSIDSFNIENLHIVYEGRGKGKRVLVHFHEEK